VRGEKWLSSELPCCAVLKNRRDLTPFLPAAPQLLIHGRARPRVAMGRGTAGRWATWPGKGARPGAHRWLPPGHTQFSVRRQPYCRGWRGWGEGQGPAGRKWGHSGVPNTGRPCRVVGRRCGGLGAVRGVAPLDRLLGDVQFACGETVGDYEPRACRGCNLACRFSPRHQASREYIPMC